ncbi:MAG: glucose-phosphate thymidylyltransferase [Chloroflexota bacterium]|jgi:glucose-1-phosphate thymidylyltransferase|nr:glucose-phosphate thymidylyltransferase [Chloroflexota bacterium]
MKGLVLSGGKGTRLRPITHTSAKQLVPVANKPILYYVLENLAEAGIRDVGMIVGDTAAEVEAACGDGSRWGLRITYLPQEAPLGLAHAVGIAESYLAGEPFVMYLGDNLLPGGIKALVQEFSERKPDAMILLTAVPDPQRFGVAILNDAGQVQSLEEKPADPRSDLALVGVYLFTAAIFDAVSAIKPSARGELEITDALQWLIDDGREVLPHLVTGWWKDTGKLEDMLEANRIVLEDAEPRNEGSVDADSRLIGKVIIEPGASIIRSLIRGPAIIGRNTVIEDSYVGPYTAIHFGCTVRGSEVEHSIVLENSSILDIEGKVTDSLIGKDVVVRRGQARPRAYKLALGDHSQVEVV